MPVDPNFAQIAALIGDPTRAAMLAALLGGRALSASELAQGAGVSPQTASSHLARLLEGGLVQVFASGRHRYYQLANPEVAHVLEALSTLATPAPITSLRQSQQAQTLRFARTCYDHLAGVVGVAFTERLVENNLLTQQDDLYQVTASGKVWLHERGIDLEAIQCRRRVVARACLDWSERRFHVAGALGAALTDWLLTQGWFRRVAGSRALRLTDEGRARFADELGLVFKP